MVFLICHNCFPNKSFLQKLTFLGSTQMSKKVQTGPEAPKPIFFWRWWVNSEGGGWILKVVGEFWRWWVNSEGVGWILKVLGKFWRCWVNPDGERTDQQCVVFLTCLFDLFRQCFRICLFVVHPHLWILFPRRAQQTAGDRLFSPDRQKYVLTGVSEICPHLYRVRGPEGITSSPRCTRDLGVDQKTLEARAM